MPDTIIFNILTNPQKSNPFRLNKGDTLTIRTTGTIAATIYSNPFEPYSASLDETVQAISASTDLTAPSECILVLDVTSVTGTVSVIIVRNSYSSE